MRLKDAVDLQKQAFKRRIELRLKKGHDYASKADCLDNFKRMAEIAKILRIDVTTGYGVALWHLLHKLVRLQNLIALKIGPENESIIDTIDDALNYLDLMRENLIDQVKGE